METQKIINLLNVSDDENSKFATKKWYIIDNEWKGNYSHEDEIKFLTSSLEPSLCDYSDAYSLVTGNVNVTGGDNNTKVAFKDCAPFKKCRTEINETFDGDVEHERDEIEGNVDLTVDNSSSFKYKSNFIGDTVADGANRKKEGVKIAIRLKYLSNF